MEEDKKRLIDEVIDMAIRGESTEKIGKKQRELLMRYTNGGKLYKYRSFDSEGHSIENLKKGTLYCPSPDLFNDPFDCNIGATFGSLFETQMDVELNELTEVVENFIRVVNEEIKVEQCKSTEKRIIENLLSNERISQLVRKIKIEGEEKDAILEDMRMLKAVIMEITRIISQDDMLKIKFKYTDQFSKTILEKMNIDELLKSEKLDVSIRDIVTSTVGGKEVDELEGVENFIKELYPEMNNQVEDSVKVIRNSSDETKRKLRELFGIGCLCTDYKNRLLWAHYADCHKGFCIEYDFSETDEKLIPLPVVYSEDRPLLPWKPAFEYNKENMDEASGELMKSLLVKDKVWKYENEWRIINHLSKGLEVKMPKISCIYLGVAISSENRKKILEIAQEKGIPVKEMYADSGRYELHARLVSE